jgi:hypothetical protein
MVRCRAQGNKAVCMRIFLGYDSREPASYHVAAHSLMTRASKTVSITPLIQDQLRAQGIYTRHKGMLESTEFSMTRFLVPYLSNYEGISIFMDCDVLVQDDIYKLVKYVDDYSLAVCKHDYTPKNEKKFLDQYQSTYPRKNWSSLMVFNNEKCKALTLDYVNKEATGLMLHRFWWLKDYDIGSIPLEWNWLVGEYEPNPDAKILHYTLGGPWFEGYKNCDHADLWLAEHDKIKV